MGNKRKIEAVKNNKDKENTYRTEMEDIILLLKTDFILKP